MINDSVVYNLISFLLVLDLYGRNDPDGVFPLFYKQVARELAPKLAVIFRHLVNRLRHRKKNRDAITGCRGNRPTNLTNHRAA